MNFKNITFQYFFFDTYEGYFLEVFPFALIAAIIFFFVKYGKDKTTAPKYKAFSTILVFYLVGLFGLVFALEIIQSVWYFILYGHWESSLHLFQLNLLLRVYFFESFGAQELFNVLAFIPFGFLYPLSSRKASFAKTLLFGFLISLGIEVLQPIVGRTTDINDLILNTLGVLAADIVFYTIRGIVRLIRKKTI